LTLREKSDGAFGDKRKRLNTQGFQGRQCARRDDLHSFCTGFPKFLDSHMVDDGGDSGRFDRRPQESCLFSIALNEMNPGPRLPGEGTGNRDPWETAA